MDGRGFYNHYNPSHFPAFFGNSAEFPPYLYPRVLTGNHMEQMYSSRDASSPGPSESQASSSHASPSQASSSSSSPEPEEPKRSYEKWTNDEEKMLISLWADNFDRIESREAHKAWDDIAKQ